MAKMSKRILALALAVCLCAGQLTVAVRADEENTTTTVTPIENGTETKTVEVDVSSGTTTTTTKTETRDPSTGTETTKTEVEKTDSSNDVVHSSEKSESTTVSGGGTQTDVQKDWASTDVQKDSQQSGQTTTDSKVITEVEGQETANQTITHDSANNTETVEGHVKGEETTDITDTETKTTITEDALLDTKTEGPATTMDDVVDPGTESDLISTGEGTWQKTGGDDGDFEATGAPKVTDLGQTPIDVDTDPLAGKNQAVLEFTAPTGTSTDTDSDTISIPLADALGNDISYTEGQMVNGYVVSLEKDSKGNLLGYTLTKYKNQTDNTADDVSVVPDQDDEDVTAVKNGGNAATSKAPVDPETNKPYTPGTEPILVDGVQVGVKTVEEVTDPATGKVSYVVTHERWENRDNTGTLADVTPEDVPQDFFTPPAMPEVPAAETVDGLTTTYTVEETQDENGNTAYTTTKLVTDADGNMVSRESETIYGTYTSHSANIERLPDYDRITTTTVTTVEGTLNTQNYTKTNTGTKTVVNTRDVTEEIYELVNINGGLYFLFEGKMYEVKSLSGHGDVTMSSLKPHSSVTGLTPSGDGAISETSDLRNPHYNDGVDVGSSVISGGYDYKYVGYGLESSITADTGGNGTLVHQFKLKDKDGNYFYALCADFNTTADRGADYSMENVWDADYYDETNAKKISAIVTNGYWGTQSGIGSLEEVVKFLKDNSDLDDTLLEGLTPGEALTATQAAIWHYGYSGESQILNGTDATGKQYTGGVDYNGNWAFQEASTNETSRINALYQALIGQNVSKANLTDHSTELLDKDNFATETKLVIKEKVRDDDGEEKTDAKGNDLYLTDVSFTVDVKKSDLTGNLRITVIDENGRKLAEEQLSTSDSNFVGKLLAPTSVTDNDCTFTLTDLELAEGVKITLNLAGTQNLEQGVYLYSAEVYSTSQTFVGIGSGTQQVNLSVDMEFSVTEPTAKIKGTKKEYSEREEDKEYYRKVDNYKKERLETKTSQEVTVKTDTYGTAIRTDIRTQDTKEARDWEHLYRYVLELTSDEDPGEEEEGGGGNLTNILDEEVPLADAPITGDITGALAAVSLISLAGMLMLKKKKED